MVRLSKKEHLTTLCKKCPLCLKYVLALPSKIRSDRLSHQHSTYMYILMNHWIATNTTGNYCLKNRHTCTCRKLHQLYIIMLEMSTSSSTNTSTWRHVANRMFHEQRESDCLLVFDASSQFVDIWDLSTCWRWTFRACSIKMV